MNIYYNKRNDTFNGKTFTLEYTFCHLFGLYRLSVWLRVGVWIYKTKALNTHHTISSPG